jgi:S-adenosylmethionine:tRNA ribosyltransferase-isomerase
MQLEDFRFELPEELIAKFPATPRDSSRLLVVNRQTSQIEHFHFYDLPKFLNPGDLLVLNNTKVLPARLFGWDKDKRSFEIFLLKSLSSSKLIWECLVRPGKKVKSGIDLQFDQGGLGRVESTPNQVFQITFTLPKGTHVLDWLFQVGNSPLPPYIKRKAEADDKTTYQTVYAKNTGSVAAPTAGLHFTENLLANLHQKGVHTAEVTLHVGYGTFSPIRTENILDHQMHSEDYEIPDKTLQEIAAAKKEKKRVFAVGTTSLRTLESYPSVGVKGSTNIYITPGYQFKMVDGLITNFHLPESSLYVLVCSLLGIERCREVYREAIQKKYRFYSYGDAMLIL